MTAETLEQMARTFWSDRTGYSPSRAEILAFARSVALRCAEIARDERDHFFSVPDCKAFGYGAEGVRMAIENFAKGERV